MSEQNTNALWAVKHELERLSSNISDLQQTIWDANNLHQQLLQAIADLAEAMKAKGETPK